MVFRRNIDESLKYWKTKSNRKPLIIRGARQVGKTTLVKNFSESYKYRIMLNLELETDFEHFNRFSEVKPLLESLFISRNISISALHETILFIDEIQESPKAIQMLRYIYEEFPGLHVIAAGSLLEFALKKVKSFPVGRVEYLYLNPLNFQEFLDAIGAQTALEYFNKIPCDQAAHLTLLTKFNQYAIIGGMPEVVSNFIENDSITDLPAVYESIWSTYKSDVVKYASNDSDRKVIKHIISSAHLYLDQRIKFQNFGQSNYRSREVGEAFRSLDAAKIIQLIYPTTDVTVPAKPDLRKAPRMQFLDTGLVNHELGIQSDMLAFTDLSNSFRGNLIPHIISQELISLNSIKDSKPIFWVRDKKQSSAEVDIVYSRKNKLIPIEIKSGSTGSLKSLHQFIEYCGHHYAVRMYGGEFSILETKTPGGKPYILMNLPYYLGTKLPEYIDYFLSNY